MKFVERATRLLNERKTIETINKLVHDQIESEISICFPKPINQRNNIYFISDKLNADTIELSLGILRILEFDFEDSEETGDVIILNRKFHSLETIERYVDDEDVTSFTPGNYDNIHAFLKRHYHPDLVRDVEAVTHPDKKQRSVSPFSTFSQKGNIKKEEPKAADKIIERLKEDSPLWEEIRRSPEVLEEACRRVKRALSAERSRPTGAAK